MLGIADGVSYGIAGSEEAGMTPIGTESEIVALDGKTLESGGTLCPLGDPISASVWHAMLTALRAIHPLTVQPVPFMPVIEGAGGPSGRVIQVDCHDRYYFVVPPAAWPCLSDLLSPACYQALVTGAEWDGQA